MNIDNIKPVAWIGSAHDDWKTFPDDVQDVMGYPFTLHNAARKPIASNPSKVLRGASVLEIVDNFDSDTYRAIYTVKYQGVVYVLHAFQKKSKKGIATPQIDIKLIKQRLKKAKVYHDENYT